MARKRRGIEEVERKMEERKKDRDGKKGIRERESGRWRDREMEKKKERERCSSREK